MNSKKKICAFNNYIPHPTPKFATKRHREMHYDDWYDYYIDNLVDMYLIFYKSISNRYGHSDLKFDNTIFSSNKYHDNIVDDKIFEDAIFKKFCMMIYNSSSKYIDNLKK